MEAKMSDDGRVGELGPVADQLGILGFALILFILLYNL